MLCVKLQNQPRSLEGVIKGGGDDIDGGRILEEERDAYPLSMKKTHKLL